MNTHTNKKPIAVISAQEEAQFLRVADLVSEEFQVACENFPLNTGEELKDCQLLLVDCSCFSPDLFL